MFLVEKLQIELSWVELMLIKIIPMGKNVLLLTHLPIRIINLVLISLHTVTVLRDLFQIMCFALLQNETLKSQFIQLKTWLAIIGFIKCIKVFQAAFPRKSFYFLNVKVKNKLTVVKYRRHELGGWSGHHTR